MRMGLMLLVFSLQAWAEEDFTVTYSVPVEEPSLQEFAQFSIRNIEIHHSEEYLTLSYRLPPELVQPENAHVELKGPINQGAYNLSGDQAFGTCELLVTDLKCTVIYPQLAIQRDTVEEFLSEQYPGDEIVRRIQVLDVFSEIPEGVLTIPTDRLTQ